MAPMATDHKRCTADTEVPAVPEEDNLARMVP